MAALPLLADDTPPPAPASASAPATLRQAANHRLLMGTALMSRQLSIPRVATLVSQQFDCITPENELKPELVQPLPGEFRFGPGDRIVDFARNNQMQVVGHTLCWHNQSPKWLFADANNQPLPREKALENLRTHINAVAGHFKGKVIGWDVVNEALADQHGKYLRDTPARKAIGDDFIVKAFEFARAADPNAELYYNDYGNENPEKRDKTVRLIRELKSKGVRIDAVGIQGHFTLRDPSTPQKLDDAIAAFAAEGVKVSITELDVDVLPRTTHGADVTIKENSGQNPYRDGLPPDVARKQADYYRAIFTVVMKHRKSISRVTFWGTHDGASWLNFWPTAGRTNYPLLWDRSFQPKPAFTAVIEVLTDPNYRRN